MVLYKLAWSWSQPRKVSQSRNLIFHVLTQLMQLVVYIKKVHQMSPCYGISLGLHQLHPFPLSPNNPIKWVGHIMASARIDL